MFHVHGIQGRVFSGTLEQLREHLLVPRVSRVQRVSAVAADASAATAAGAGGGGRPTGAAAEAVQAYGQPAHVRQPLVCAADVMRSPALTVPAAATLREAWQELGRHGIAQAPVVGGDGRLVGLVGRIELMPPDALEPPTAASESARLSQPVTAVMWSPVPSTAPETDLRRVAALLLRTGLPGVPVAGDTGAVLGFVSRTDLLRALVTDPPLELWA